MDRYEFQVTGHVDAHRARALGCDDCRHLADGRSVLTYAAVDAAATYGLIARLRDAGLELVAVSRLAPPDPDRASPTPSSGRS